MIHLYTNVKIEQCWPAMMSNSTYLSSKTRFKPFDKKTKNNGEKKKALFSTCVG